MLSQYNNIILHSVRTVNKSDSFVSTLNEVTFAKFNQLRHFINRAKVNNINGIFKYRPI